jgi:hypothetical protein
MTVLSSAIFKGVFKNKSYQKWRENRCCVCGGTEKLAKHHVVPSCYISKIYKQFPVIKSEVLYEYDFCCLCHDCHIKYNKHFQMDFHQKIWDKYGVDISKTSYHKVSLEERRSLPSPSSVVAEQIKTSEDYISFRQFCTDLFIQAMKPKHPLLGFYEESLCQTSC